MAVSTAEDAGHKRVQQPQVQHGRDVAALQRGRQGEQARDARGGLGMSHACGCVAALKLAVPTSATLLEPKP